MRVDSRVPHARLEEVDVRVEQQGDAVSVLRDHVASVSGRQDAADALQDAATAVLSHHGRQLNHMDTSVAAQQRGLGEESLTDVRAAQDGSRQAVLAHAKRLDSVALPPYAAVVTYTPAQEPPFPSFMQPEDEVFVGQDAVLDRLAASLEWRQLRWYRCWRWCRQWSYWR
jgi:hypothetical protein